MTRTLEIWRAFVARTGKENPADYLIVGGIVTEDLIDYIRIHMPLKTDKSDYLQLDEIQGYCYDLGHVLRPIYSTFSESNAQWRYLGSCFQFEIISKF